MKCKFITYDVQINISIANMAGTPWIGCVKEKWGLSRFMRSWKYIKAYFGVKIEHKCCIMMVHNISVAKSRKRCIGRTQKAGTYHSDFFIGIS